MFVINLIKPEFNINNLKIIFKCTRRVGHVPVVESEHCTAHMGHWVGVEVLNATRVE